MSFEEDPIKNLYFRNSSDSCMCEPIECGGSCAVCRHATICSINSLFEEDEEVNFSQGTPIPSKILEDLIRDEPEIAKQLESYGMSGFVARRLLLQIIRYTFTAASASEGDAEQKTQALARRFPIERAQLYGIMLFYGISRSLINRIVTAAVRYTLKKLKSRRNP